MTADLIVPIALIGAASAYLLRRTRPATTTIALLSLLLAVILALTTPEGWTRETLGLELGLSSLSRLFLLGSLGMVGIVICLASYRGEREQFEAVALLLVAAISLASLSSSDPLLPVFGLAIAYLVVLFLGSNRRVDGRVSAGAPWLSFAVMIGFSTFCLVIAFTLIQSYTVSRDPTLIQLIIPLLGIGFGILLAQFPLHTWLPKLLEQSSPMATALLCSAASFQAVGLLLHTLSSHPWLLLSTRGGDLLLIGGVGGLLCCSLLALWQTRLARSIAYLAAADVGCILVGLALHTPASIASSVWITFSHALGLVLMLSGLAAMERPAGGEFELGKEGGGLTATVTVLIGGLAMIGLPPLAAFPGKWTLFLSAGSTSGLLLAAMVLGSLISTLALIRCLAPKLQAGLAEVAPSVSVGQLQRRPLLVTVGAAAIAALVFATGLYPAPLQAAIRVAVHHLAIVL